MVETFYYQDQNADSGLYCMTNLSNNFCSCTPKIEDKFE